MATPSKFTIFSKLNVVISDLLLDLCQLSSLVFRELLFEVFRVKRKLSYFEPFQFELVLSRQTCQRNYALGKGLGTKYLTTKTSFGCSKLVLLKLALFKSWYII